MSHPHYDILLDCQRDYLAAMAKGKSTEMNEKAKETDKSNHAELNRLRAEAANAECFDCNAKKPGWAVLPWGVYLCIDCAQVHRNLGRHLSQTKAINTGTYLWYPHEMRVMREVGNERALRAFANGPTKPSRDASAETKVAYNKNKYDQRRWGSGFVATTGVVAAPEPSGPQAKVPPVRDAHVVRDSPLLSKRTKGPTSLQAKRAPTVFHEPLFDLISLEPATSSQASANPTPCHQSERQEDFFADWEAANAPVASTPVTSGADNGEKGWQQKSDRVLAMFVQPSQNCSQEAKLFTSSNAIKSAFSPDPFFARYGL